MIFSIFFLLLEIGTSEVGRTKGILREQQHLLKFSSTWGCRQPKVFILDPCKTTFLLFRYKAKIDTSKHLGFLLVSCSLVWYQLLEIAWYGQSRGNFWSFCTNSLLCWRLAFTSNVSRDQRLLMVWFDIYLRHLMD